MNKLQLIVATEARVAWRWARTHLYALLILAPLIVGMTYFSVSRWIESAPDLSLSPRAAFSAAFVAAFCLVISSLSRTTREIFHIRQPASMFDTLPVDTTTLLHAAVARRLARSAFVGVAIIAVRPLVDANHGANLEATLGLAAFVSVTALIQIFASLNWVHWSHARDLKTALAAFVALLVSTTIEMLLLIMIFNRGMLPTESGLWILSGAGIWAILLYLLVRLCFRRWRVEDLEWAKRLQTRKRQRFFGGLARMRFLKPPVRAELARDLRLTVGIFSSAVYVSAGLAALWVASIATVLASNILPAATTPAVGWFETTWQPALLTVKIGSVGAVAALTALLPVLVHHQISRLWLERSVGTVGAELWQAKLWYARIISFPAPAARMAGWDVERPSAGVLCAFATGGMSMGVVADEHADRFTEL
ncbi:MAG: hypothetical protein WKF84_01815 [Pyrinomonadaceae bacterium]